MTAAPSSSRVPSRPGRWTLTTTGVPSASAARYTCEIEALAIGVQSNAENTSAGSRPSCAVTCGRISASGAGPALERSSDSSSHHARGRTSLRVDATCPSLTKIPPASSRVRRTPPGSDSAVTPRDTTPFLRASDTTWR